ncbi:MAG: carboxylesterase/lipase family protein, partial [Actinobacteria bacterium]|nr:carboxylesterase/lipase family protein [Actinomycetota bacterium]
MNAAVITTRAGQIAGTDDGITATWKGVRYAQAPVGPLRFRAPVPVAPWEGVVQATEFGPAAPQKANPSVPLGPDTVTDEDCLSLNVWRSAATPAAPLPVMVWLHGGAYTFGASSQPLFDGTTLVSTGEVLLVTVNYRIGALGFLDLSGFSDETQAFDSNLALRDVMLALEWVQANAAAFGGDPHQVTLAGESAGAGLVTAMMAVPSAAHLFHRAIVESSPVSSMYDSARARTVVDRMLTELGLDASQVGRLRELPADDLVTAGMAVYAEVPAQAPGTLAFAPVVDGDLLPEHPVRVLREGRANPVPLLIGTNKDEAALFTFMKSPLIPITEEAITTMLTQMARQDTSIELPTREQILATYAGQRARGTGLGIAREIGFRMPTLWAAEGHAAVAPVFLYRFDHSTPMLKVLRLGATHATELPYVWGNLHADSKDLTFVLGGRGAGREVSHRMVARWRSFVTTGAPTGSDELVLWPPFDPHTRRATLVIDHQDSVV